MSTTTPTDRNLVPIRDTALLVPFGNYPKVVGINKFGENHSILQDTTETVWEGSNTYPYPDGVDITHVSQKVDQVALRGTVLEVQGLDEDWNKTHQDVTFDALDTTTPVALATPLRRCFRAFVKSDVVTDQVITVHNAANNVDYAYITAGENQTTMAIYTVPAGHEAYMTLYYAYHHPAQGSQPTSMNVKLLATDNANGYAQRIQHTVGIAVARNFRHYFNPYYKFTEKTDICINVEAIGSTVHISAGFDLMLVDLR
jgi:hypothetical protein